MTLPGGGTLNLAVLTQAQLALDPYAYGIDPKLGIKTGIKPKPPVQDEKPFEIWGLQHRPYSDAELREAFDMLDLDKHGYIGPQDIRRVLDLCGEINVMDPEVNEMLRLVD